MVIQEPVQAAIWQCLNHYAYSDAIFLAERLYAEVGSDEALFLLATCYYRAGKSNRAYSLLQMKGCPTPQCRYLMARCCLDLDKLAEGEAALVGNAVLKPHSCEEIKTEFADSASFALALLARICSKTERKARSSESLRQSLKLNPFLWSSFADLCNLGEKPDPSKVFQMAPDPDVATTQQDLYPIIDTENMSVNHQQTPTLDSPLTVETPQDNSNITLQLSGIKPLSNFFTPDQQQGDLYHTPAEAGLALLLPPAAPATAISSSRLQRTRPRVGRNLLGGPVSASPLTPSFGVLPVDTPSPAETMTTTYITPSPTVLDSQAVDIRAPQKRGISRRSQVTKPAVFSQSGNSSNTNTKDPSQMLLNQTPSPQPSAAQVLFPSSQGVRRSSRLFSNNSVKENATKKTTTRSKIGPSRCPKGKTKGKSSRTSTVTQPPDSEDLIKPDNYRTLESRAAYAAVSQQQQLMSFQKASTEGLLALLREIGKAYLALSQYDCRKAIAYFSSLPPQHYNTGWVLSQVGRAWYELAEYQKAERLFSEVRRLEPYHLEGTEYYSTALWHLHKEVALSMLAQELSNFEQESPEAWCATGNCFSLQKEHDLAIKFFQRAVQVDPQFAYAYTLLGHEYVATEELDKAMSCYRTAIRINTKHYNAWYGVGMIYYKQEKFALAEMHYRKALAINPQSSVLLCHIGVVQHAQHKSQQALQTLNRAITMDPNNPLCKFHRASIYFATERYQEALQELEELKQIIPKESLVYFIMGKVYKKCGQTHLALANFSWAVDLDPKGANNQIKEALDKRYLPDDDDPAAEALADPGPSNADTGDSDTVGEGDVAQEGTVEAEDMQLQANESDESL
ncbi:cell division cycle protein 27 homolog isoform X2 [Acanthaster planci]|uniref:Cell division cycle protein 27 homolog n=1 Tax=Acanthaster planci TaxID=133434 RepID=A0A8B7Z0C5_ACAPL|nr:cell division cycle protein 27 homolog isoform X2 [Acanthaster planci]